MAQIDYDKVNFLLAVLAAKDTKTIETKDGGYAMLQEDAIQGKDREQVKKDLLSELQVTNKAGAKILTLS